MTPVRPKREPLTPERFRELVEEGAALREAVEKACRPGRIVTADDMSRRSR